MAVQIVTSLYLEGTTVPVLLHVCTLPENHSITVLAFYVVGTENAQGLLSIKLPQQSAHFSPTFHVKKYKYFATAACVIFLQTYQEINSPFYFSFLSKVNVAMAMWGKTSKTNIHLTQNAMFTQTNDSNTMNSETIRCVMYECEQPIHNSQKTYIYVCAYCMFVHDPWRIPVLRRTKLLFSICKKRQWLMGRLHNGNVSLPFWQQTARPLSQFKILYLCIPKG